VPGLLRSQNRLRGGRLWPPRLVVSGRPLLAKRISMLNRDEATELWKTWSDNLYKALTQGQGHSEEQYLTFKEHVFAIVRGDPVFLKEIVDFLTPQVETSDDRRRIAEMLVTALAEEIKANTRELQRLGERQAMNPRKKNLEALRHVTLERAGTVTGSIKDFGETFFEKNTYAKGGLTLLKELIEIRKSGAK
jgi:hypothetical protein